MSTHTCVSTTVSLVRHHGLLELSGSSVSFGHSVFATICSSIEMAPKRPQSHPKSSRCKCANNDLGCMEPLVLRLKGIPRHQKPLKKGSKNELNEQNAKMRKSLPRDSLGGAICFITLWTLPSEVCGGTQ